MKPIKEKTRSIIDIYGGIEKYLLSTEWAEVWNAKDMVFDSTWNMLYRTMKGI